MAFLPIAERELRIASRRKGTHRIRVGTTLVGLLVSVFFIATQAIMRGWGRNLGQSLFAILSYYAFGLSLLAGVALTADCISAEKREGTLGLLFLTDLKGHDVVFGKLMVTGLSALCGLVAVLPVTGLPLLMGGVTGAEFFRVSLALVNTLFFALATGLLVSTMSREANKAIATTMAILLIITVALPLMSWMLSRIAPSARWQYFTSFSPFISFNYGVESIYQSGASRYWYSLLSSNLTAWVMLFSASWILPHAWQENVFRSGRAPQRRLASGKRQSLAANWKVTPGPSKLLDKNPICWLVQRGNSFGKMAWVCAILGVTGTSFMLWLNAGPAGMLAMSSFIWILMFVIKILVAIQACRFFTEVRGTGALEVILSTPLKDDEIIRGQWMAIRHNFLWPVLLIFASQLAEALLLDRINANMLPTINAKTSLVFGGTAFTTNPMIHVMQISMIAYKTLKSAGDICALGWVGMWLGLTIKKPSLAVLMTVLFAWWLPTFVVCIPNPLIDLVLCCVIRDKLHNRLRNPQTTFY